MLAWNGPRTVGLALACAGAGIGLVAADPDQHLDAVARIADEAGALIISSTSPSCRSSRASRQASPRRDAASRWRGRGYARPRRDPAPPYDMALGTVWRSAQ
jgi:acyl-CoA synthetase (AMP-forming)/AMP-acid ligase II